MAPRRGGSRAASAGRSATPRVWRARQASRRLARSGSESASTAAASRAALTAPARPMARVPTGMPAGICTIDRRLSWPERALDSTGTPKTGSGRQRRGHAGQVGGAAGAGDDDPEPCRLGALGEGDEAVGRAVGGDDAGVVGDAERVERLGRVAHGRPVGLAAHDDGDGRARHDRLRRQVSRPHSPGLSPWQAGDPRPAPAGAGAQAMMSGVSSSSMWAMRSFRMSLRFFSRWIWSWSPAADPLQRLDGGVEVAMFLLQPGELGPQLRPALVVETPPPSPLRRDRSPQSWRKRGGLCARAPVPGKAEPPRAGLLAMRSTCKLISCGRNICFRLGPRPMAHSGTSEQLQEGPTCRCRPI